MDKIRAEAVGAQAEEEALLNQRKAAKNAAVKRERQVQTAGGVFGLGLILLVFVLLKREIALRAGVEEDLREHQEQLSGLIEVRTGELRASEERLRQANTGLEQRVAAQTAEIRKDKETLEKRVAERTEALRLANASMGDASRAALNLMEDAVAARTKTEQSNADLLRSELRLALLSDAAATLLKAEDPQLTIQQICREAMKLLGCQVFFNYLYVKDKGRLRLNAYAGVPPEEAARIEWLDYGVAVCGCVARDGERIIAEDIFTVKDPRTDLVRGYGVRAYCCHPLLAGKETLGTISFGATDRDKFSAEEVEIMKATADLVAIAIQRKLLGENARMLAAIVDYSTDAIIGKNLEGIIFSWNKGAQEIYGYTPEEVIGKPVAMLRAPGQEDEVPDILARIGRGEEIANFETTRSTKSGRVMDVSLTISPVRDSNNAVTGFSTIARDISARKKMEENLKRSNENLEQFAYVASHDLQEPLRMMASYSELLSRRYKGKLDQDADEFIGYIVDGAKRLQKLINDLLAYSRVGRADNTETEVDCKSVLERVLGGMRTTIAESGAAVTSEGLPVLRGVETNFIQLFQNLIGNALKFRGAEKPAVRIKAVRQGAGWLFSVKDNGIGMDPQYKERIFVIFQRLHGRGKYPGTGIGLSICKKIVELLGGRIWVEAEPGKGATFYFTVPADGIKEN
jgi:PAS domain S-box-containing protein